MDDRGLERGGWRSGDVVMGATDGTETVTPGADSLPIESASLRLRRLVVEDAARMLELNGEPSTRRWLPSHVYQDERVATARLGFLIECYASPGHPSAGPYVLAVEHRETRALLGHVGFSPLGTEVEVSYAIAEATRRRGYGSEALVTACRWVAQRFAVSSLVAITERENVPSRRTLERAAFVHERDVLMTFQGSEQLVSRYRWRPT